MVVDTLIAALLVWFTIHLRSGMVKHTHVACMPHHTVRFPHGAAYSSVRRPSVDHLTAQPDGLAALELHVSHSMQIASGDIRVVLHGDTAKIAGKISLNAILHG